MKILEVHTPKTIQLWLQMPRALYKDDKNWIPHIKQDIQKVFDPQKNKLFKEGKAQRWLLMDNTQKVIGRIAAFHFPKLSVGQSHKIGGLGFFECINNKDAAHLLFDTATSWLKSEGMEAVDGPINFGERDAFWGLLVENFQDISSYKMNYNLPYYKELFESYGFQTYFEQWCFRRDIYKPILEVFNKKLSAISDNPNFKITNVRGKSDRQIALDFCEVYNSAWAGTAGLKRMEHQQALQIVKAMKPIMDKDIMVFAYYEDKPVGFYINIPELNEIFRHVNGNLNWWGKIKFLYYKYFGKKETMVGLVFGVSKEFQGRGVESALIKYGEQEIARLNRYSQTILTWIGDFNPKMLKIVENLEAQKYRTLITYRKYFDESIPFERCPPLN